MSQEQISKDFYKAYYNFFSKTFYQSDNGFFLEDIKKFETVTYTGTGQMNFALQSEYNFPPGVMTIYQILTQNTEADLHKRTYQKLQDYLANMGGILGLVMTIGGYISVFITEGLCSKDIVMLLLKENKKEKVQKVFLDNTIRIIPNYETPLNNDEPQFNDDLQQRFYKKDREVLRINPINSNRGIIQPGQNSEEYDCPVDSKIDSINMEYSSGQNKEIAKPYSLTNRKYYGNISSQIYSNNMNSSAGNIRNHSKYNKKRNDDRRDDKSSSYSSSEKSSSEKSSSEKSSEQKHHHDRKRKDNNQPIEDKLQKYDIKKTDKISWYHSLFAVFFGCCCKNKKIVLIKEYQDYVTRKLSVDFIISQLNKIDKGYAYLAKNGNTNIISEVGPVQNRNYQKNSIEMNQLNSPDVPNIQEIENNNEERNSQKVEYTQNNQELQNTNDKGNSPEIQYTQNNQGVQYNHRTRQPRK